MNNNVKKSVIKVVRKLISFALKYDNLVMKVEVDSNPASVWVWLHHSDDCSYMKLTMPLDEHGIKDFEQRAENEMAKLAIESRKLTKEGNE